MSLFISRKVFLVVAGGNASAQRNFEDTIQRKRTLEEVRKFLTAQAIENLEKIYHGSNFIVWGSVPGPMNESRWEKMAPGDVVLINITAQTIPPSRRKVAHLFRNPTVDLAVRILVR